MLTIILNNINVFIFVVLKKEISWKYHIIALGQP